MVDEAAWWSISYEMCCKAQVLFDSMGDKGKVVVGDEEAKSTMEEIGSPEMGWFSMGPYIEDELWASQGDHLL